MPCFSPLNAYKLSGELTKNGKSVIVWDLKETKGINYEEITMACGQCIGCRIQRSKDWAVRCVHEASLYSHNCFVTLTFDDDHMAHSKSLIKSDFQKFMKRLRKRHMGIDAVENEKGDVSYPIRFYHCGEYGEECVTCGMSRIRCTCKVFVKGLGRPHHHACIFNFDFDDKVHWSTRNGVKLFRSPELERLWPFGFCTVGDVTYESAAYVARYILKKFIGDKKDEHYIRIDRETGECMQVEPEYTTMSRRPGIGKNWFQRYSSDIYPKDFITINGKIFKSPNYYDRQIEKVDPAILDLMKERRKEKADKISKEEKSISRMRVKYICCERMLNIRERTIENES